MKTKMHRGAYPNLFGFAKMMRKYPTKAEEILWQRLRGKQTGYKFRRQHPFGNYVADFYCHLLKYVIEVDGKIHNQPMNKLEDENKELNLESCGYFIDRFTNEEVIQNIEMVMNQIHETLELLSSHK